MSEEKGIEEMVPIFSFFSPADYRYSVKELEPFLSEEAFVKYKSKIEAALALILARRGIIDKSAAEEISNASSQVTAKEVYEEESRTGHDIIAQVNMIKKG